MGNIKIKNLNTRKIALLGVLCALSLIMFLLENLLPSLFLPGAKIGLSNIFTLLTLFIFSQYEAILLVLIRTLLGSLIVGNAFSLIYSLSAGIISICVSSLLVKYLHPKISLLSISIVSAITHNIVQVLIFCLLVKSINMLAYLPYFALLGILSGTIVGFITYLIIHKIPISYFEKILKYESNINNYEKEKLC